MHRWVAMGALMLVTSGCTRVMRPTPDVRLQKGAPIPLTASVVVSDALRAQVDEYGSFGTLGAANTWVCETGEGFVPALEQTMAGTFAKALTVATVPQATGDATVTVTVDRVKVTERQGFWVAVELHAVATDAKGAVKLDRRYAEEHEGSTAAAFFGGAGAGTPALLVPTEEGMARALEKLAVDLRAAFAAPVVAVAPVAPAAVAPADDAPPGPPPEPPPPLAEGETLPPGTGCLPACRAGYVCGPNRTCVSICNPPCGAGETCTPDARCVPAAPVVVVAPPPPREEVEVRREEPPQRSSSADAFLAVHADLMGFAQLGPTLTVEAGTRFSGLVRARFMSVGLIPNLFIGTLSLPLARAFSVGAGGRFYSAGRGNLRGFYVGPFVDVVTTSVVHPTEANSSGKGLAYETLGVLPALELGYRWGFGHFLLGIGGAAGAHVPVYAKRTPISCTEGCVVLPSTAAQRAPFPYGSFNLDLGVLF